MNHTVGGYPVDHIETQQKCCSILAAILKKRKIFGVKFLLGRNTLSTSKFKPINFHLSFQATFLSHFLSKGQAFFSLPWLKIMRFLSSFFLSFNIFPFKCFLDSLFSSPCLGIYLAGLPNLRSLPSYRKENTDTQIMKDYHIIQRRNDGCYRNNGLKR